MKNVWIIIGEDGFLVDKAAEKVVAGASLLEKIDSVASSNEELQLRDLAAVRESFFTPPFMEPDKTTWWRNVDFLPQAGKSPPAPTKTVKEALEKFAAELAAATVAPNQKLVITGKRLLASSKFAKDAAKFADMNVMAAKKGWQAVNSASASARELAAESGLSFAPGALEAFVAKVGFDTHSILNEIAKLRDWIGEEKRPVSREDVSQVVSPGIGIEAPVWDVTDALGERNAAKALAALERMGRLDSGSGSGFAIAVTTGIEKFFRELAACADAERIKPGSGADALSPFSYRKYLGFLPKWTVGELRRERARFLALRQRVVSVSGKEGTDALVVAEVARACMAPGGRGGVR